MSSIPYDQNLLFPVICCFLWRVEGPGLVWRLSIVVIGSIYSAAREG